MNILSDEKIAALIAEEKTIPGGLSPIKPMSERCQHKRRNFDIEPTASGKGYSLTDCISMQTMREEGLTEVLTNDRHFEQKGFRALFRNS